MRTFYLYTALFLVIFTSRNCLSQTLDSIHLDPFNNFDSAIPSMKYDLNELPVPTLFVLDEKKLIGKKFSDLAIEKNSLESITIIQNEKELAELGYHRFKSVVLLRSKSKEKSN